MPDKQTLLLWTTNTPHESCGNRTAKSCCQLDQQMSCGDDDRDTMGRVKWTQRTKDVMGGEYRYLSPVLEYDTLNVARRAFGVALTNSPPALDG